MQRAIETVGRVADEDYAKALVAGLAARQKSIPSRFFYDARGSALFERITELPEYYPTRTEIAILRAQASAMADFAGPSAVLVEPGSGSSRKTEILIAALERPSAYVPIEISADAVAAATARLTQRFPHLSIKPIVGDMRRLSRLPVEEPSSRRVGCFPGSTLGNFGPDEAAAFLDRLGRLLGPDSRLILGIDLAKAPDVILRAYDDNAGITEAFNKNLLVRANHALGADFDITTFRHAVTYDSEAARLDMWLESTRDQDVHLGDRQFRFRTGERIHTEHSHKYDRRRIMELAGAAHWHLAAWWTDPEQTFAVVGLRRAGS
jgi:dimethylhistidine N-methyltransferase